MAGVTVFVGMTGMTVVMNMGLCSHRHYSTRSTAAMQPYPVLITHYDTLTLRID
jgi:hypothetical protein